MQMATRRLEVQITGDARKAKAAMGDVESRAGRMRSKLNGIAKGVAVGIAAGGVALAVGVVAGLKSAYTAALESRKISRETERVVRTTGKAAGVSAKYVGKYAGKLSMLTGVDDEVIAVRRERAADVHEGDRIKVGKPATTMFDQASARRAGHVVGVGHGPEDGSVIQVGKALNDPIKGITALCKAGRCVVHGAAEGADQDAGRVGRHARRPEDHPEASSPPSSVAPRRRRRLRWTS
jgi:F0F1-type ATP synthase membrane subunit c/vacuolar-type H+-ATPase subunit K